MNDPACRSNVLIVDDEPAIRQLMGTFLSLCDLTPIEACSAKEALAILEHVEIDLLVTDLRMPGMGGLELAARARADQRHLPILLVSGCPGEETSRFAADPLCWFLEKPFSSFELISKVRCALRDSSGSQVFVDLEVSNGL